VHTNSELGLMLKGIKPLAVFADAYQAFPECVVRYLRCFDRQVDQGHLRKSEFVEPLSLPHLPHVRGIHQIYYTLPGHEWRVDAMLELMAREGPWSAAREREQGHLLGYEDWQNDVWAKQFPYRG
jgi:hypothetical protein